VDTIQDLRTEAKNHYSGNLYLASDLDRYKLDKSGRLSKVESYS